MNLSREEIKVLRDSGQISKSHASVMLQQLLKQQAPVIEMAAKIEAPVAVPPPQPEIDRHVMKANDSAQTQSEMVKNTLDAMMSLINSKPSPRKIIKFTVSRNSKDLITEIIPHYSK